MSLSGLLEQVIIPKLENLVKIIKFIKSKFKNKIPKVLYGGSVNPENIKLFKKY